MARNDDWASALGGLLSGFASTYIPAQDRKAQLAFRREQMDMQRQQNELANQLRRDQLADASYQRQFTREQAISKAMDDYNSARRTWEQTRAIAGSDLAGPEPMPPSILQGSGLMGGGFGGRDGMMRIPQGIPSAPSKIQYGPTMPNAAPVSSAPPSPGMDVADVPMDIQGTQKLPGFITGARTDKLIPEFDNRLNAFAQAYLAATGEPLQLTDSYRDYAGQVDVKNRKGGWAATPGNSMHGYGAAVDINPAQADKAALLGLLGMYGLDRPLNNRAQRPEPWHIQPAGLDEQGLRATGPSGYKPGSDYSGFLAIMDGGKQPQGTAQAQAPQQPWDMGTNVAQAGGQILTDAGGRSPSSQSTQPSTGQGQTSGPRDIRWWVNNATDADLARLSVVKPDLAKTVFEIRKRNEPQNDIVEREDGTYMVDKRTGQYRKIEGIPGKDTGNFTDPNDKLIFKLAPGYGNGNSEGQDRQYEQAWYNKYGNPKTMPDGSIVRMTPPPNIPTPNGMQTGEVVGKKPLTANDAGKIQGANLSTAYLNDVEKKLFPGGKYDRMAMMKSYLPGTDEADIRNKIREAIGYALYLKTGAAATPKEIAEQETLYTPGLADSEMTAKSKLDRLKAFLGSVVQGTGRDKANGATGSWDQQTPASPDIKSKYGLE